MASSKRVHVECAGAETRLLDDLVEFQGGLKELSQLSFTKLRSRIIELGFSEPLSVWQHNGQALILNGHQRFRVLRHMRDEEGWEVPPVPVSLIECADEHAAKLKVLSLTSEYGDLDEDGLYEFMCDADIAPVEIEDFRFPRVSIPNFLDAYFGDNPPAELDFSPELHERHDYVVLYFETDDDWKRAQEAFGIVTVKSAQVANRTFEHRGLGRVIAGADVLPRLEGGVDG